ncbi:hypothetical protein B9W62_21340 [Streptomyces sp. CS113]|nr:hypothetical protein B9W62_21340 [Streptomyces sp. CS113]
MDVVVFRGELSNRFPPLHVPAVRHRPVADVRVPHLWDCWDFAIVEHHEAHHETSAPAPGHRDPRHFAPPFSAVVRLTHRGSTIHHRRHR